MRVVVGLGNPGRKYESSLHNLGFQVLDLLADRLGKSDWESKFDGLLSQGGSGEARYKLLKPQTFMNHSGRSVAALLRFYKVELAELLVIVDDLDLEVGKVRLRERGSDGGHLGLRSVNRECGGEDFKRIRIGVGRPPQGRTVVAHVLGRTSNEEIAEKLAQGRETAAQRAHAFIVQGVFENWSSS